MDTLADIAATAIDSVPRRPVIRVDPAAGVKAVIAMMREQEVNAVSVVEGDAVIGIFTDRDLMLRVDVRSSDWGAQPIRTVMTASPTVLREGQTLEQAINAMIVGEYRHLPLVSADGALLGMVSILDLLAHIAEFFPEDFLNLPPDPDHEASHSWGG